MNKLTKSQQKREIIAADVKHSKQSTLDTLSFQLNIERSKEAIKPAKAIVINRIVDTTKRRVSTKD
jgi:hypothetical protein